MTKQEQIEKVRQLLGQACTALEVLHKEAEGRILSSSNEADMVDLHIHFAYQGLDTIQNQMDTALEYLERQQQHG